MQTFQFCQKTRKKNILKKLIVGSKEEKYTSTSWAAPREFWLRPKHWKQGEEGWALWSNDVGSTVRGVRYIKKKKRRGGGGLTLANMQLFCEMLFSGFSNALRKIRFHLLTGIFLKIFPSDRFPDYNRPQDFQPPTVLIASVPRGHYSANKLAFSHDLA